MLQPKYHLAPIIQNCRGIVRKDRSDSTGRKSVYRKKKKNIVKSIHPSLHSESKIKTIFKQLIVSVFKRWNNKCVIAYVQREYFFYELCIRAVFGLVRETSLSVYHYSNKCWAFFWGNSMRVSVARTCGEQIRPPSLV